GVAALVCLWQLGVKSRKYYLLLLIPIAAVALIISNGDALHQRFDQTNLDSARTKEEREAAGSAEERKLLLIQSLNITTQYPVFGVGPGNFSVVSGNWRVTHNSYTQVSSEGGLPAIILYLMVLWSAVTNIKDLRPYRHQSSEIRLFSIALLASIGAFIVGSFF